MKELLDKLAAYNLWANGLIAGVVATLDEATLHKDMGDSFGGIYKTVIHLAEVENIWWRRLRLLQDLPLFDKEIKISFTELNDQWIALSKQWLDWVREADERKLTHVFEYQNSRKEFFKQPVYEMLAHLFNHQTFHRGQLVTMMRQNGIEKIPPTDFIVFSRKKL